MPSHRRPGAPAATRSAAFALSVALVGILVPMATADADTREADLRACAAAATKQERHARRCWRYDAVERETWRDYDNAAPRDWQAPKDWERR